jgi:hypothetical protein
MKFSDYRRAVFYPLTIWLVFDLIAFGFGFTAFPDLSKAFLLSDVTPLFLATMFGLWIGAESYDISGLAGAARNAITVSFTVGLIIILLTLMLINGSPIFLTYVSSVYSNNLSVQAPILNLSLSTWIGNIFVSTIAALAGFGIISKARKK